MAQIDYENYKNAGAGISRFREARVPAWNLVVPAPLESPEAFKPAIAPLIRVPVAGLNDIVRARHAGCGLAQTLRFSGSRTALVTTAISELARNLIMYANHGEIVLSKMDYRSRDAVVVIAEDSGPGITDLQAALSGGAGGRGRGLSGLKHIVDEFEIKSQPGIGTRVIVVIVKN